ncbi:glycosyl hydrolase family 18 protein [Streptoverticillium reticulum]|uniref:glycosyl hydrolase family 18 protein n=1 Tax=Streptoverticillium reticulum TaxID=1433415 RepID=UPI0039BF0D87
MPIALRHPALRMTAAIALAAGLASCATPSSREDEPPRPALQAWIYPGSTGEPTCEAPAEYRDGRLREGVLKPEYWKVNPEGTLALHTTDADAPCNGFSEANAADVKAHSAQQYTTVSAMDRSTVAALAGNADRRATAIGKMTDLARRTGFTGVDVDFEDFWNWSEEDEADYETFLSELARSLHAAGLKLQVDAPAELHDGDSPFNFAKVMGTGVDQLTVMAYGRVFATPAGERCWAIAPEAWVREAVRYAQSQIPDKDRLVIGLPSYGFSAPDPCDTKKIQDSVPVSELRKRPGWSDDAAVIRQRRDPGSGEIRWSGGGVLYDAMDGAAMDTRLALLGRMGVRHVSVWALGGNPWFSSTAE